MKKDIGTIAVIGPNADDVEVLLGNYNGNPTEPVTPLEGIRNKVSEKTTVLHAQGCELAENLPYLTIIPSSAFFTSMDGRRQNGLTVEYYDNRDFEGEPSATGIDERIDANWWDSAPVEGFDDDNFGVRWTGELIPPVTGTYALGGYGFTGFRIYLDDKQLIMFENRHHPVKVYENVFLEAGKSYKIKVEFYDKQGDAHMSLLWQVPGRDLRREAIEAAEKADAVVMVMGLSPRLEGEEMNVAVEGFSGGDRLSLSLPAVQEDLIRTIHSLGKPVVLVLLNGSAVAVNWANGHIPAIVEAWYGGQAAGSAIADILFGDYNPAGRLPVTFYQSVDQLPPFEDYNMEGKTYRYFRGEPLYPFGYGLSYTRFEYRNLRLPKTVRAGEEANMFRSM